MFPAISPTPTHEAPPSPTDFSRDVPAKSRSVANAARASLRRQPYRSLAAIECDFEDGVLTLRGLVNSYFLKQVAQTAVADVRGVVRVVNNIEVHYPQGLGGHTVPPATNPASNIGS